MIDRDKKVGDLTVGELEQILSGFSYSFNPKYYFPPYIGDGMPPELRENIEIEYTTETRMKK